MSLFNNSYTMVLARSVDILCATWIWRDYDITVSSMTGLAMRKPQPPLWARWLNWFLNKLQRNHCELAIAADTARARAALALLNDHETKQT